MDCKTNRNSCQDVDAHCLLVFKPISMPLTKCRFFLHNPYFFYKLQLLATPSYKCIEYTNIDGYKNMTRAYFSSVGTTLLVYSPIYLNICKLGYLYRPIYEHYMRKCPFATVFLLGTVRKGGVTAPKHFEKSKFL